MTYILNALAHLGDVILCPIYVSKLIGPSLKQHTTWICRNWYIKLQGMCSKYMCLIPVLLFSELFSFPITSPVAKVSMFRLQWRMSLRSTS